MRVQRVVMPVTGAESWTVLDDEWAPVEPVVWVLRLPRSQRLEAALDEITRLKADNHQLREHLAQHLGHRRHNRIPDPVSDMPPT